MLENWSSMAIRSAFSVCLRFQLGSCRVRIVILEIWAWKGFGLFMRILDEFSVFGLGLGWMVLGKLGLISDRVGHSVCMCEGPIWENFKVGMWFVDDVQRVLTFETGLEPFGELDVWERFLYGGGIVEGYFVRSGGYRTVWFLPLKSERDVKLSL